MTMLREIMTGDIELVPADAPLQAAAALMKRRRTGVLLVVEAGQLVGTLTDRDITVKAAAEDRHPATTRVRDVMTPDLTCAYEDQDVREAAGLMSRMLVLRLPVVDRRRRPVGLVSLGDIAVMAAELMRPTPGFESIGEKGEEVEKAFR